jgi:putative addiction module antidote
MFSQKLYKNGNSVAVTIPKEYLKKYNMRDGTEVVVEGDTDRIVITSKKTKAVASVDAKFARMVDEFMNEHEDVLKKLSKR